MTRRCEKLNTRVGQSGAAALKDYIWDGVEASEYTEGWENLEKWCRFEEMCHGNRSDQGL